MDPRLILSAFLTIFVAELGDKTQLATMGMASSSQGGKWAVFVGASLALIATTAIGVLLGDAITRVIPEAWIKRGAGLLFIGMGMFYIYESLGRGEG